jgi:pimeloyl-ACP methyl ester carboxylesterase
VTIRRWIGVALVALAVQSVGSTPVRHTPSLLGIDSRFMGAVPDGVVAWNPFSALDPSRDVLIVYLNGSTVEPKSDACDTSKPGINIPHAAADLAGMTVAGHVLRLFAFCTPTKTGGFNQPEGDGVTKVARRAEDLDALLTFVADAGVPSDRTFLMGQSAGAWAGLLTMRRGATPVAGLIGFAPAFAGHDDTRKAVWRAERDRQAAYIGEARRLDALIYGFIGDPYEPPAAMGWLREVPGVRYLALSGRTIGGVHCDNRFPHATVFKDCFRETQRDEILGFIASRLAGRPE